MWLCQHEAYAYDEWRDVFDRVSHAKVQTQRPRITALLGFMFLEVVFSLVVCCFCINIYALYLTCIVLVDSFGLSACLVACLSFGLCRAMVPTA